MANRINAKFSRNKGCGCLIGTSIINFEVERRKKALKLAQISKRLKKAKDKDKIKQIKKERAIILKELKEAKANKEQMKTKFHKHIKESGYVPPKLKVNLKNKA